MGSGKDRRERGGREGRGRGSTINFGISLGWGGLPPQDGESYFNAMMF